MAFLLNTKQSQVSVSFSTKNNMGQQYSAIYRYVIRTIDKRLSEMNISKLSLSPRDLFLLRRHSCVLVLQYLKYSRQSELKELRVQHINDNSFTPDEIQSIDRIVRTMIFRCHRRSNQRRTALGSQSSPNSRSPTCTPPLAEMFPNMRERSFSTPNLGPLDGPNNGIHGEWVDPILWATVCATFI
ncbi:hypothetical protein FGIG_09460 [Fasciola gigantica]|uniref:Uncharacterized protein n=1 Tax=Fasciola gigantica TaxID=46835 RepID=A0A504YG33_FASGI|nr:hypothetical protein FGIG_09460 [Fasciola gigantica]